jgi:hypothetical protein
MATLKVRKNNEKTYQVQIDGKTKEIKTACKTFGDCILNDKGENTCKKKCVGNVKSACFTVKSEKVKKESEKTAKGTRVARNVFGHTIGSSAEKIDVCIELGTYTKKEIAEKVGSTVGRVSSHIYHLIKKRGLSVNTPKNGKITFGKVTV